MSARLDTKVQLGPGFRQPHLGKSVSRTNLLITSKRRPQSGFDEQNVFLAWAERLPGVAYNNASVIAAADTSVAIISTTSSLSMGICHRMVPTFTVCVVLT
jgi:hypothetical protein